MNKQQQKQNIQSFKDLIVWQKGIELTQEIYKTTAKLPSEERFGLTSQMRRSAVSIPSNIAEGRQRSSRKDFAQFLHIAQGSASELETQIVITEKLYSDIDFSKAKALMEEIQKMLAKLRKNIRNPQFPNPKPQTSNPTPKT